MTIERGIRVAVYCVSKANEYIDKCGGGPDITTLSHDGTLRFEDPTKIGNSGFLVGRK
jgi:hypothetical protein